MLYLAGFIMILLEVSTCYLIFENLYEKRESKKSYYLWFYIGTFILMCMCNLLKIVDVNFFCSILCYTLLLSMIYKVTILEVFFWITTIACINVTIEGCAYFSTKMLSDLSNDTSLFWIWFSVITDVLKGLVFCIVLFLVSRLNKEIYIHLMAKIMMVTGAFIICNILINRFAEEDNINVLTIEVPANCLILNLILIVILGMISGYFWIQMGRERSEKQKMIFERQKNKLKEQHYQSVQKINTANRQLVHNMHHYFDAIRVLATEGKTSEIVSLLGEIEEIYKSRKNRNYCDEPIVNAILLDKAAKCKEEHISFEADVELGLDFSGIKSIDLVTILGNLIENAIEVNMKCKEEERWIKIRVFRPDVAKYIIFEVNNHFNGI